MTTFDQISQIITDDSQPVATRRAAVIEMADYSQEQALPFLLQALHDDAPGVRRETANVLQKFSSPEVTTALLDAIRSEENDLTLWTFIEVLGEIGTLTTLPVLQDLLNTTLSPLTQRVVAKSVEQITARLPNNNSIEDEKDQHLESDAPDVDEILDSPNLEQEQLDQDSTLEEVNVNAVGDDSQALQVVSDEVSNVDVDSIPDEMDDESTNSDVSIAEIIDEIQQKPRVIASEEPDEEETEVQDIEIDTDPTSISEEDSLEELEPGGTAIKRMGTTPSLPVLIPNTSVVIYEPEDHQFQPSVFALVLRPTTYLSKRWVSRSRLYFVLLSLLLAAVSMLVYSQVQRQPRSPYKPNAAIAHMENPEKYVDAGSFFIQEGDYRSAIETLEFIRGVDSMGIDMYRNLGYAYFQENHFALAAESYEYYLQFRKAKTYRPFEAEASYQHNIGEEIGGPIDYNTYNLLGSAYQHIGNLHKAREAFEKAIKLAPLEAEAYNNLSKLYVDGFQNRNYLSEALAFAAVRINPEVASYHDTLGLHYYKDGRLNKGTNSLKQAIRLQSDYIPAHFHLSEIAEKSKNPEMAIQVVKRELVDNLRPSSNSRSDMISVLSYIYETDAQKISRLSSSLLHLRGVSR